MARVAKFLKVYGVTPSEGSKRRYPAHFISKLTDSDGLRLVAYASESELQETLHWLASAEGCGYITSEKSKELQAQAITIGRQLGSMINKHESFCF